MKKKNVKTQAFVLSALTALSLTVATTTAFAQSNAFVTSGSGGGASSTARLAAQVAQLQVQLNAIEACGAKSMLYGGAGFSGSKDGDNCSLGLVVNTANALQAENNLRVGGTSTAPSGEALYVTGNTLIEGTGSAASLNLGSGTQQGVVSSPNQFSINSTNQWVRISGNLSAAHTLLLGVVGPAGIKHTYGAGSTNKLQFGVSTSTLPSNPTPARYNTLVITSTDRVGIGSDNPTEKLHVDGNTLADAYFYTSDSRLKKDVKALDDGLERIKELKPVNFTWKKNGQKSPGFIAQEVEEIIPEIVATGENGIKSVDYAKLVAHLVSALQEQQRQIEILEERIEAIE